MMNLDGFRNYLSLLLLYTKTIRNKCKDFKFGKILFSWTDNPRYGSILLWHKIVIFVPKRNEMHLFCQISQKNNSNLSASHWLSLGWLSAGYRLAMAPNQYTSRHRDTTMYLNFTWLQAILHRL